MKNKIIKRASDATKFGDVITINEVIVISKGDVTFEVLKNDEKVKTFPNYELALEYAHRYFVKG